MNGLFLISGSMFLIGIAPVARSYQSHSGSNSPGYELTLSIPGPGEAYGQTVTGDFDGDCQLDVAYALEDRIEVVLAPGLYEALMTDVAIGTTMAVLPAGSRAAGSSRDSLLVTDTGGLWRVDFTGGGSQPWTLWSRTLVASVGWKNIIALSTWSSGNKTWIYGLKADGRRVARLSSTSGSIDMKPVFDTAGTFSDLVALDRDASGTPELAALGSNDVVIYDLDGSEPPVVHHLNGITSDLLVRLHHSDRDWLAWVASSNSNGSQLFCTLGRVGAADVMSNVLNLGSTLGIVAIASGDVNCDGDDDLVVSATSSWDLTWLPNQGHGTGAPVFQTSSAVIRGSGLLGSAALNSALPAIGDIDGDGDGDVCFPQRGSSSMWIYKEGCIPHVPRTPQVVMDLDDPPGETGIGAYVDADHVLRFRIDLPDTVPGWATHMEIAAWTQASATQIVDPATKRTWSIALQGIPVAVPPYEVTLQLAGESTSLAPSSDYHDRSFDELVWVSVQLSQRANSSSPPVWCGPGRVLVFHAQGDARQTIDELDPPNEVFVRSMVVGDGFQVEASLDEGIQPGGDGQDVGSGGDVPCLPIPPNTPPASG